VRYHEVVTQRQAPAAPAHDALPAGFGDDLGWLITQCFRAHVDALDRAVAGVPQGLRGLQALRGAVNCSARNQAELARQLGLDRTVMVYLVDDLVKAGLVERITDPSDRRSKLVRGTEAGRRLLDEVTAAIAAADSVVLRPLPPDDQTRFREMLRTIAAHYIATGGDSNVCEVVVSASEARP
jgi:DNA-binding MarR family transcriptional regulator